MQFTGNGIGGHYKTDDNVILEIDADGKRKVRFRPTPARETPDAMEQLTLAYLDARNDANINQLLLIPCVILDFLCIHPFRDGNGRMSRLLSLLLLYKNGFDAGKYVSFEEQINNYKAYYYEAPRSAGKATKTPTSRLLRIFCPRFICATKNWTSVLLWCMEGRLPRKPASRQPF